MKIRLFEDVNPESTENFRKLCEGHLNEKGKTLSYKGRKFVNKLAGFFIETETIGETIYNGNILNESYEVKFDREGIVGMSRTDDLPLEESNSGFFITFGPLPNLEKYVALGEVVEGLDQFKKYTKENNDIEISDCGVL